MKIQLLAILVVFALTYFLLRLRHFILAPGKGQRKYYGAYLIKFETDHPPASESESEIEWPTEIEIPADYAACAQKSQP